MTHLKRGLARLLSQYTRAVRLRAYLGGFLRSGDEVEASLQDLWLSRNLETATGASLDVIGELVGQERVSGYRTDTLYRLLIKVRIASNRTHSTVGDLLATAHFLFGETTTVLLVEANTAYTIQLGLEKPNANALQLINSTLFPKTLGVGGGHIADTFITARPFGFEGVVNARGFGGLLDPKAGGTLGNLLDTGATP